MTDRIEAVGRIGKVTLPAVQRCFYSCWVSRLVKLSCAGVQIDKHDLCAMGKQTRRFDPER